MKIHMQVGEPPMPEQPIRIQLSRTRGWRMPENTLKIDRSTRWGNHFHVIACEDGAFEVRCRLPDSDSAPKAAAGTLAAALGAAVGLYGAWLNSEWGIHTRRRAKDELRSKNLACWCRLCERHHAGRPFGEACAACQPCHADVLGRVANGLTCEPLAPARTA
ncbi:MULTISPECIES: DUF4326 domain-containing protein [unclassified Xanthobacter]|uniref:DUF4326 domain-containing protein n=1 Tax=unclassified Xanthobacter TaxID=2623496 RepID=UPI001F21EB64|nr:MULTISPECIES: DUF4326 domain-containing protein [unclassified Xanthobacter]